MATLEMPSPGNEILVESSLKADKARDFKWYCFGVFVFLVLVGAVGMITYLKMEDDKKGLASTPVPVSVTPAVVKPEELVEVAAKKAAKVEVLNGSGVVGAAKVNSDKIKAKDKTLVISVGNNPEEVSKTVVIYKDEGFRKGDFSVVAKSLWPSAEEKVQGDLAVDVRIILGK